MMETTVSIFTLQSPLMNASGCYSSAYDQLDMLSLNINCGAIVSKSGTLTPQEGHQIPRLYLNDIGSINSMGLPNAGYEYYSNYNQTRPYIQSIYPYSTSDLALMLTNINKTSIQKLVEINLSCPNIRNNLRSLEVYLETVKELRLDNLTLGVKMKPIFDINQYSPISNILIKNNIKFITCTNSIPNGLIVSTLREKPLISPFNGVGGIGGGYIKPIALSNVYHFYKHLNKKVDIIGCGGISTGDDVFQYILCGANAVQIGTQLLKEGSNVFTRLNTELINIMKLKGYNNLESFRGRIHYSKL